jgi:galactokinase
VIRSRVRNELEAAGLGEDAARGHAERLARMAGVFEIGRPSRRERSAWFVPGRIEILGKHTDYAGGRSLVCAAERGFCVLAAPRTDSRLIIVDLGRVVSIDLDPTLSAPGSSWGVYPWTVLARVRRNFPEATRGCDLMLDSDLPTAAGLSSSSALMIGVLLALNRANDLESTSRWSENIHGLEDLAAYAATIENGRSFRALAGESGVGTEGGSEDHTAILCSQPGAVAQYAFCPTRHERSIRFASELLFAIGVSGVAAQKTGNARDDYNRASRSAARILEQWNADSGRQDESLAAAIASSPDAAVRLRERLCEMRDTDPLLVDRLDQFVEESTVLVPAAADQLALSDLDGFGATAARSQELAERLLRNQVPETVALVGAARDCGAYAASAFGAGFGGSAWALVERSTADAFLDRWQNAYATACSAAAPRAKFFLTRPGPAALRLSEFVG